MVFFSFNQVKYKIVLILSIVIFGLCYICDTLNQPQHTETIYLAGYVSGIMIACFWGILNYIDHLRINPLYKQANTINEFVDELELDSDDKLELKTFMEDYVNDQVANGNDVESATNDVISQFKAQEFTGNQLSKDTFFFHSHYYLIGNGLILFLIGIVFWFLFSQFHLAILVTIELLGICYAFGFWLLFILYKFLNMILKKKS
ncbi:MAG TPA: hypothetical protein VNM45_16175 [Bacillus sp. (in: firmicutes)]|nr:hypothetical protein [Bacillus sp. (in: firmicutes)]